jgi:YD repeat-containing protein
MRTTWYLLFGVLAACAPDAPPIPAIALGEPAGPVTLIREANGSADGGYDLFLPVRPIPIGDDVWVLEGGNDQLVRFDSTLTRAQSFAREGEGPGEIQFAQDLLTEGGRLIVAETGNGRFSSFDTTGAFISSIATSKSPRFAAIAAGRLVATFDAPEAYAYAVDAQGRLTTHAPIPDEIVRLAASDPSVYLAAGPYIATSTTGELIVLDQSVLALSVFTPDGRLVATRLLPEPYRSRLLERRLTQRAAWGKNAAAFIDSPAAKRIYLDREGRLLVLFPLPDSWGLLIETEGWTARPLMLPENTRLRDILWAASDATLDGDRLLVVSGHQLYQFAVEGWR